MNVNFIWHAWKLSLVKDDPKKWLNLRGFMLALIKSGKSWKDMIGQRKWIIGTGGTKVYSSDSSWCHSSILEIKSLLSWGCRQDTAHVGIFWPFSQEKSRGKLTDLSISIFSNSFSLKYSICHSAILWGSVLNPISYCGI